jgi:hypothetical protein
VIILGGLRRLEGALGRAFSRWGVGRVPRVYITEYGYETNPPDPFRGVSWSRQAAWTSWAEEIAYRDRHVASFPQFLLADDHPRPGLAPSDPRRWITWQSGLLTEDGREKPSYTEYQHPIRVAPTRTRRGRSIRVFGLYRPAATGVPIRGRIELRGEGGLWEPLRELTVTNPRGYLYVRVPLRSSGSLRIAWTDPASGASVPSRAVRVLAR